MTAPLVHVDLCERCALRLGWLIDAPSYHEGQRLEEIASELDRCERCKRHAERLRSTAGRWQESEAWAWVEL